MKQTTIAAIATAIVPQQGSIGIVRLSGAEAVSMAQQLFQAPGNQLWESHRVLYGYIRNPSTQQVIDEGLLLLMLAPRSYTREDVVELHCHGGIIAVQQVLEACLQVGAELAQPGEFTLRAFLNGRLDLTQAEGVADLVGARSPQAAQAALAGVQGKLASPIRELRQRCLDTLAEVEARVDFEDDLPPLDESGVQAELQEIHATLQAILATADQGELLRNGLKVAIIGRPNVGKSSLLNAWCRCDRAIVTDLPGTTRDVVESQLVVGGIPVQVLDTAGIRETKDQVEQIGVNRSHQAAQSADLVLLTIDAAAGWTAADQHLYQAFQDLPMILIINKVDLVPTQKVNYPDTITQVVSTIAAQNQGISALETAILDTVQTQSLQAANLDWAINQRQAAALQKAQTALEHVQGAMADQLPLDFWTIDLRGAIQALGEITGEDITESVLDRIFSRFCIGK
ncbi:tRNA uridine-5-carboxymethylaminomethyl(34) synthesis GTPase MnmE [Acaryochloris sp. 'Moss Beach']|uniref:tRNA uridine-5-carboxymethylaminomethyl(34) synthesis GTPase MnmE n=1 Tax=Acaryochloris TaxID=155977 RepID=UPI001BAFE3ED|nr:MULTISPECIES: tRNA uridine-5-carboxymethylaminomethyl(34) synthesis GTPase MnmE [Acaryochloris]QUY41538.1 tRNA uridine-5-carboxymethylaminomethyl(34) synthesis GTPase MnmE [Acaryochloris marina S15]UJB70710.1 tRNA uridine-5-carboxymethylaminomethyl(34) synthesis GTPase MnmE [Acaryochloris sp. 'Moss Beach']